MIWAVDEYAEVLRLSAATPGNDHRLGANEAPPAIISIFLGDLLTEVMESIASGKPMGSTDSGTIKIGASTLPHLPKDNTDRNRTSPFAFTGNKFEFRMVGSSQSISGPNFVLNTMVADILDRVAEKLENAENLAAAVQNLVKEVWKDHKKVVFNGNGYSAEWVEEAAKRGLPNLNNTVDSIQKLTDKKNVELFERQNVLNAAELHAREEVVLEHYINTINIEALTMIEMSKRDLLPAGMKYAAQLADTVAKLKALDVEASAQTETLKEIAALCAITNNNIKALEKAVSKAVDCEDVKTRAASYRDDVFTAMSKLRESVDAMEVICDSEIWPIPSYGELLFSVR